MAAVVAAAAERPADGVIAVGDRPVVLAARVAEVLGLPWHPPDAARASAHKRLARERMVQAGLPAPRYLSTTVDADPIELSRRARYPAVVKPVSLSGSRGVIRVDTPEALVAAFGRVSTLLSRPEIRALRTGSEHEILIEDFIPGREYAVEGLMSRGAFSCLAVFDKPDPLDGPFFEETIYVTPPRADAGVRRAIVAAVAAAAAALGLAHGPIHAECRVSPAGHGRQAAAGARAGSGGAPDRRVVLAGAAFQRRTRRPSRSSTCCSVMPSANECQRRVTISPRR